MNTIQSLGELINDIFTCESYEHISFESNYNKVYEIATQQTQKAFFELGRVVDLSTSKGIIGVFNNTTTIDELLSAIKQTEIFQAYETLKEVSSRFTVAAAFGNVHGVYKPGNVELTPIILKNSQDYVKEKHGTGDRPIHFVFHGGSGSSREHIREAIGYGVVKMNLDTDMQWAYWDGVHDYYKANKDYLNAQLGNPEGDEKPNKKYYDPRMSLRSGEEAMAARLIKAADDLNCVNVLN